MLLRGYHFLPPTPPTPDTEVPQAELPQTGEHTRNTGLFGAAEREKEINGRLTGRKRTYGSTG